MYVNWYKVAKIQQEAGLKEAIPTTILSALLMLFGGSTLFNAIEKHNLSQEEANQVEELSRNPRIYELMQQENAGTGEQVANQVDDNLLANLRELEGTIEAQTARGIVRNNMFFPYNDHLGNPTIGYGHLILPTENFANGITEQQADEMLRNDAQGAMDEANQLIQTHNAPDNVNTIITEMVFQMGSEGVNGFNNMWNALEQNNFDIAADEMLDSQWANQTPNRARNLSERMRNTR